MGSGSARADLRQAVGWMLLGAAVVVGSVTMDRLEQQHINPYTVPGLMPGLLGLVMVLLGGVLALRSRRRLALHNDVQTNDLVAAANAAEQRRRVWIVTALCVGYGVVLVGHGLPFWLASTVYVTGSILILQRLGRDDEARRLSWGTALRALVIGAGASVTTHLVFQQLFLVRLP
jgi:Tripartite tricarboxylate transporter TctB family